MDIGWSKPDPIRVTSDRPYGITLFLLQVVGGLIWFDFSIHSRDQLCRAPRTLAEDFSAKFGSPHSSLSRPKTLPVLAIGRPLHRSKNQEKKKAAASPYSLR